MSQGGGYILLADDNATDAELTIRALEIGGVGEKVVWVQDEPQNQGPWFQIQHNLFESMESGQRLSYAGRSASASPAVGYADKHVAQQKELLETAFSKLKGFILTK